MKLIRYNEPIKPMRSRSGCPGLVKGKSLVFTYVVPEAVTDPNCAYTLYRVVKLGALLPWRNNISLVLFGVGSTVRAKIVFTRKGIKPNNLSERLMKLVVDLGEVIPGARYRFEFGKDTYSSNVSIMHGLNGGFLHAYRHKVNGTWPERLWLLKPAILSKFRHTVPIDFKLERLIRESND